MSKKEFEDEDFVGFKYFKTLSELFDPLHLAGCQRDRAHNRRLHMDEYISLLLMYFFNPICDSLRGIQRASELEKIQRVLKVPRSSLGSLSEAQSIFDSSLLKNIIGELADKLKPLKRTPKLDDVKAIITLVDGTLINALPKMTWALWQNEHNALKAHVQFELLKGVPVDATITIGNGDERQVLSNNLQPGRIYIFDRGYLKHQLFQQIIDIGSNLVGRIRDNSVFEVIDERLLSDEALDAGIVRDAVVNLGGGEDLISQVRIVEIECKPHPKNHRKGRGGPGQGETMLIATDRLDLPAEVVALLYKHRWEIEIFFRFFKHILGCRKLLSQSKNGIELQTYAAIIACLLIALWTERKPTKATYEIMCYFFMDWASQEEVLAHIKKLKDQDNKKIPG